MILTKWIKKWLKRHIRITRDSVIFLTGIAGIVHEVFLTTLDRPDILILFTAMIGLPAFLRNDEFRNAVTKNHNKPQEDTNNANNTPRSQTSQIPKLSGGLPEYDDLDPW